MPGGDDGAESGRSTAVPDAFYRDAVPPVPARDDPHWVEFSCDDASDTLPEWGLMAIPVIVGVVMLLHGVLAIILLYLLQH